MAGFIPEAVLEQIRAASDIVDVIGAAIPLKRSGANFMALCPFHREKTPSFNVNPRKQIFHCFGCHKGGDVFTFIREYEGLDFVESVKRLAERARIPIQFDQDPAAREKHFLKDKLLEIHEQITQRWHNCLLSEAGAQRARDYLRQRGVSDEALKVFRLGYAPESWEDTVNWAKSKAFDLPLVEQGGLIVKKEGAASYYTRFRDRLMFPICDEQGRVIGFSGRILPGDDDPRKYVNSPETPLFTKSRVMFGLDKSKRALLDKQSAIICEGQLDLIACFMAGVQNVVAPQGTALTGEHTRILKRYVNEVVLCFDSDAAGQRATVRVLDDLLGSGLAIRVATVPAPHDPDSFIKEFGAPAFQERIDKAQGFFDYYLERLCATNDINTDKGRQTVVRAMAEAARKTRDETTFDRAAQRTAARVGLNPLTALKTFQKALQGSASAAAVEEEPVATHMERPSPHEYYLLKVVLAEDALLDWVRSHLDLNWVRHPIVRSVVAQRLTNDEQGNPLQPPAVLNSMEDPQAQSLITEALAEEASISKPAQVLVDVTTRLRNDHIDKQLAQIMQSLGNPALAEDENKRLLQEQLALRQLKRQALPAA